MYWKISAIISSSVVGAGLRSKDASDVENIFSGPCSFKCHPIPVFWVAAGMDDAVHV